jgi:hypothetical protein
MVIKITKEQVITGARRAVEKVGEDFVYTGGCQYFNDEGQPDCIIGHVFNYAGFDVSDLASAALPAEYNNMMSIANLVAQGVVLADAEAITLMQLLQMRQDDRDNAEPWSDIVGEVLP